MRLPCNDGRVYRMFSMKKIDFSMEPDPFKIQDNFIVRPPNLSPRIYAQAACFSVSKNPWEPLQPKTPFKKKKEREREYSGIIITSNNKRSILDELDRYGINPATLFPGLDGICKRITYYVDGEVDYQLEHLDL